MSSGTVKWFNPGKGFGFIQPEDGSKDVFVHISAVERSGLGNLVEGQRLSFDPELAQSGDARAVLVWNYGQAKVSHSLQIKSQVFSLKGRTLRTKAVFLH